jgi:hypothetical protein
MVYAFDCLNDEPFFYSSTSVFKRFEKMPDHRSSSSCHKCICMDIRNRRSANGSMYMSFSHKGLNYSQLLTHDNVRPRPDMHILSAVRGI